MKCTHRISAYTVVLCDIPKWYFKRGDQFYILVKHLNTVADTAQAQSLCAQIMNNGTLGTVVDQNEVDYLEDVTLAMLGLTSFQVMLDTFHTKMPHKKAYLRHAESLHTS